MEGTFNIFSGFYRVYMFYDVDHTSLCFLINDSDEEVS